MHRFYIGKKYLPCWSVGKKYLSKGKSSNPPSPSKVKWFAPYYPTVLVIVQKARETSTNIPRYCTVGYCKLPCARSSCNTCSFLSSYWKRLKKVKLDNKSRIRCFCVKYCSIFLLVVCILTRPTGSGTQRQFLLCDMPILMKKFLSSLHATECFHRNRPY